MQDLCVETICQLIDQESFGIPFNIEIHDELDSTNSYLKQSKLDGNHMMSVVIARCQKAGRGQRNKKWVSEWNSGLWMSMALHIDRKAHSSSLSLVIGCVLVQELHKLGLKEVGLKWPNDLISGANKLGGVLVETVRDSNGRLKVIIGIGINIDLPKSIAEIQQTGIQPIGLNALTNKAISMPSLIANFVQSAYCAIRKFENTGFRPFYKEWLNYDVLQGRKIVVEENDDFISGINDGIDNNGALLVTNGSGTRHIVNGSIKDFDTKGMQ
ncbi:MAG: biotin--[acetyl-CoA-carboxylase] ligase [Pseudomonadota bacterium]|nr:biotin--[acetyl-CoA-carboxylase] ligase [Pseudomonadota bacterium]